MLFRTVFRQILDRLESIEQRLAAIEASNAATLQQAQQREAALREQLERKQRELEALGAQGLHVVDQLDQARRRIRELEGKG
jgi:septal ring factor EnvC (AmiA/AmiB activator)